MKELSDIISAIPASAATAVDYIVRERRERGEDVISFVVGEPDFPTDQAAAEAGIRAIRCGQTRYTPPAGTRELTEAIADAMLRDFGLHYDPSEIAATSGGKFAVFTSVAVLCRPGDEFIIPTPCWPSYEAIVRLSGGTPVFARCGEENGFRLTAEILRACCTEHTKALILNVPGNPSGVVYDCAEMNAIMEECRRQDIYVIADDVYGRLIYDGLEFVPAASVSADARARTITIGSTSKSYAMTGWRIGWLCAEKAITEKIRIYINHTTGNPCSVSQAAAAEALRGGGAYTERMSREYERRRDILVPALHGMGLPCRMPQGAFYAMADVRKLGYADGREFAVKLMERENVAVVPCGEYGAPGYVRLSYTLSEERMREGLARMERFIRGGSFH